MTGAMDKFYMKLSENGPSKFGGMIQTISSIMTGVFAVSVGVVIAGLAMMAKGAYDSVAYRDWETDRKSTRLNSSHSAKSRMPSSA